MNRSARGTPRSTLSEEGPVRRPEVLHLDEDLLVVDKPAGLIAGAGNVRAAGVAEQLRGRGGIPEDEPFTAAHKVEPGSSGVVIYARTPAALEALATQADDGRMAAVYQVLVSGYVDDDGAVELKLHFHKARGRYEASRSRGKDARTAYRILERVMGHTWLEVTPDHSWPDQVRIHLASIGHPLAIDPLFGGEDPILLSNYKPGYRVSRKHDERPLISHLTLHAARLTCVHPRSAAPLAFESPVPKDFRAALKQLGRLL